MGARKLGFWPGQRPSLRRESRQAPHEAGKTEPTGQSDNAPTRR
ncbi:hypothetical protein [Mobiluncus mulieris]|nr:hypothetical protein [Mobiluncus mulieris]